MDFGQTENLRLVYLLDLLLEEKKTGKIKHIEKNSSLSCYQMQQLTERPMRALGINL